MLFYILVAIVGLSQAAKLDEAKTQEVDWSARTDIALLLNSGYENVSAQLMDLVTQCNNSLNAAVTYCDSNCQQTVGSGGLNQFETAIKTIGDGFNKIESGVKKTTSDIKTEFNKFTAKVEKLGDKQTWANLGKTFVNLGEKIKQGTASLTSKAISGLSKVTSDIGNKAKEWSNSAKNWFKDTFNLRRKRAALPATLTCELCTTISTATEGEVLNAVCGTTMTSQITLLSQTLEKMSTLMTSIEEGPLVTEVDTDSTNIKVSATPTGTLLVTAPIQSVVYNVTGTMKTISGSANPVDIMSSTEIANEVVPLIYEDYFKVGKVP